MDKDRKEIDFARRLADPNKTKRDRALKKLNEWLVYQSSKPPGFDEMDMMRVWKGLFYSMWMSDKPSVQEQLANQLSNLIYSFHNSEHSFQFIKTFFLTMQREWTGIDRLRIDKFYMLMSIFLRESFFFLKKHEWNQGLCDSFATLLADGPLNVKAQFVSLGISLHVTDKFLGELLSVADSKLTCDLFNVLLHPIYVLAANCQSPALLDNICDCIFKPLLELSEDSPLQIDFSLIAENLFTVAADTLTRAKNRRELYALREMFLEKLAPDDVVEIESPAKKRCHNSDVPGSGDSATVDDDISVNFRRSKRIQALSPSPQMKLNFDSITVDGREKKSSKIPVLKKKRIIRFSGKHYKAYEPIGKKKFVVSTLSPGKSLLKNKDPGPLSPLEKRRRRIRARLNAKLD